MNFKGYLSEEVRDEQGNYRGFKFRIETKNKPSNTGMFDAFDEGKDVYYRDFFASEPDTLVELSVVLYNLDDLSDRSSFQSLGGFNAESTIKEAKIFDHKKVLKQKQGRI